MTFIDTNIFVYAVDDSDRAKFEKSCSIVFRAVSDRNYVISAQVLNELTSVMYRKLKKSDEEVLGFLDLVGGVRSVQVLPEWTWRAVRVKMEYGTQFYDSLLLVAAEAAGCDTILTEDLNDGQVYNGVRAVNPFKDAASTSSTHLHG